MEDTTIVERDFDNAGLSIMGGGRNILWLPKFTNNPTDMAYANHELLHITLSILKWSGIKLSDDSEEAFTYELQYLSKQFYSKLLNDGK